MPFPEIITTLSLLYEKGNYFYPHKPYSMKMACVIILVSLTITLFPAYSQSAAGSKDHTAAQWYFADPQSDRIPGISLDKTYKFLEGRQGRKVVVAILDSGLDTAHADIKGNLWVNPREIPGNDVDDDGNGYVDDVHGWNFLGNLSGENIASETLEQTRLYRKFHPVYGTMKEKDVPAGKQAEFDLYLKAKEFYEKDVAESQRNLFNHKLMLSEFDASVSVLEQHIKGSDLTPEVVRAIKAETGNLFKAKNFYLLIYQHGVSRSDIEGWIAYEESVLSTKLNLDNDPRHIAGDDPNNIQDSLYGNNDLQAGTPGHGTSVGGLVGAIRGNGIGIDGIADNVAIMVIRIVPGGDERDKDVALGIRYAVNQGARIINCSFGKDFSPEKWMVDEAVRYAESHGVLIVHGSGNDGKDNDATENYPTPFFSNGIRATNMIEVGSSTKYRSKLLPSPFSNYGRTTVDLFAPGSEIMTLKPGGYGSSSGTSLAAPVVTGVATIILSYYPELTPAELRKILMKSVSSFKWKKVNIPGGKGKTRMKKLSVSGGVVNAFKAVKLAEKIRRKK